MLFGIADTLLNFAGNSDALEASNEVDAGPTPMEEEGIKEADILNDNDVVPSTQGGVEVSLQEEDEVTIPPTFIQAIFAPKVATDFCGFKSLFTKDRVSK